MTSQGFVQFYKTILNTKDHDVLSRITPEVDNATSNALCSLFVSRYDKEKSERQLLSSLCDNPTEIDLFAIIAATESVYVRYKNERLLHDVFDYCKNHSAVLSESAADTLSLTLKAFCCDKLRFFASETKNDGDKKIFSVMRDKLIAALQNASYTDYAAFTPLFILAYTPEKADELLVSSGSSIARIKERAISPKLLLSILFSVRGLLLYGYFDIADDIKNYVFDCFLRYGFAHNATVKTVQDRLWASAILGELALSD